MEDNFKLEIISPERIVFSDEYNYGNTSLHMKEI